MDDLISRQAAIDALDFEIVHMTAYCDGKNEGNPLAQYNKGLEDGKKAIEALPSAQPKQTDCEYCHEDSDGYVKPIEKNCHAFVRFGMDGWELSLKANGWHGSAKIRYCPMCGRELKK